MPGGNKSLYVARINAGLTQGELADQIGVSRQMVNYYENGRARPSRETATKLAAFIREWVA